MATTTDKFFAQRPQLNNEKDWPVWKFQVTGTADRGRQGYEAEGFPLDPSMHWAEPIRDEVPKDCGTHYV